jgi:serine/threonine protein kinase
VPGGRYGRYRLEERLGAGGLAEVWRATDFATGRVLAVKRFMGALASADAERLRAEIELLAATALRGHPNVVEVVDGGADPEPHVVMEYLDGGDLGREIARAGRLSVERTLEVGIAIASALAAAADAGVVHGDVKPSNVLLGSDGAIKLADFNVARVIGYRGGSVPGSMLVSFAYAAPEVWDGTISTASDLYALGCVLYECLTGHPPFTGSYAAVFRAHTDMSPDLTALPVDTPGELAALIGDLLQKDPARRPSDPHAVVIRLTDLSSSQQPVQTSDLWPTFGPWLIEAPHPVTPWAWFVRHRQSGRVATVELVFGDQETGERLQHVVAVNPQLVPLGAESLIETNRLLLRPDQSLGRPTPPGWIFWVVRDELPAPEHAVRLDGAALATAVERIRRLVIAAGNAGVALDLSPANLVVHEDGRIHVRRPGIAPVSVPADSNALATLRQSVVPGLVPLVARAGSLGQLADELGRGDSTSEVWGTPQTSPAATIRGSEAPTVPLDVITAAAATATAVAPAPWGADARVTPASIVATRPHPAPRSRRARDDDSRSAGIAAALLVALGLLVLGGIAFVLSGGLGGRTSPESTVFVGAPIEPTASASLGPIAPPTSLPTFPTATVSPLAAPTPLATLTPTLSPVPTEAPTPPPTLAPTPAPTLAPTPPPPPAAAWRVALASSDTRANNGELVSFTATASDNVAGSGYVIQIFNPDTGFVHRQCGSGNTCSIGGRRENTTARYRARISAPDGSNVQARSETITVTWSSAVEPEGWNVGITSSQQTAANGERVNITATANRNVAGTGYVIQIFNPDTGFIHWTCRSGRVCTVGARRQDITTAYQARISTPDGANVQALSERITVTWQ